MGHCNTDIPKFCEDILSLPPLDINCHPLQADSAGFNGRQARHGPNPASTSWWEPSLMEWEVVEFPPQPTTQPTKAPDFLDYWCPDGWAAGCPCLDAGHHAQPAERVDSSDYSTPHSHSRASSSNGSLAHGHSSSNRSSIVEIPSSRDSSQRLPAEATKVLKSWFYEHQNYPYPNEREREELEQLTGLNKTQISNWFTNSRRRRGTSMASTPDTSSCENSILSPLERWKHSPPENEAAATSDIMRALEEPPCSFEEAAPRSTSLGALSSRSSRSSFILGAPSMSSCEQSQSSGSEASFQQSHRYPRRPPTPIPGMGPRRRRRKPPRPVPRPKDRKAPGKCLYQCTFCSDTFGSKYDWQRHEKALHLPVDRWHCAPGGGICEVDGVRVCVFCFAQNPDSQHLESHNYHSCRQRPPELRTFSRKDHLRQHLRLTHNVDYDPSMEHWRHLTTRVISRCGFCETNFTTWDARVDHLAEHFKNGVDMDQWKGDWGFEPDVERLVTHAMPPYLLGQERRTMDPWKISEALQSVEDELPSLNANVPNAFNRYTGLRDALLAYLRDQAAMSINPSDQMIQDHARQVAYEGNDYWNSTYADDLRWLEALRREAGIT
ncbi:hypothetical protein P168DRAFT_328997 [Aspergillus campestris IBT 28561]|uniref:Homeobox protein meis n=1 Tax=Aspergillus campestris (strain IBT 28561) TaxID=1392248 RepID=A0A2I1CWL1_ASPC2|nr:uncharacterized protein P168DRAFT_328997 [Aspergillus campestris IBT 28561]PKY02009.1 hypothetical protein P168DRAFT_328997 [Aspergillus campestris IBT 28561]